MQYIQERSFIATLTSITPGNEGILDSVEGNHVPAQRTHTWLTITSPFSVESQQRFWFGYFDGQNAGYQVRTVASGNGTSHYDVWDLSTNNFVGYYPKSDNPVLWRVRVDGQKIGIPECGTYNVTLAAPGQLLFGVRKREKQWQDRYVEVDADAKIKLLIEMDVLEVNVPLFDEYSKFLRR
ncbi:MULTISPECIES: hypothetical protein [Pseudomonas]|uniref:hypothetical protein n=1 Tax=Pseudomonas TaxID=286 RepID=UPI000FABC262|nr:hypothetical protein [Pseudomonas fluorescens]